VAGRKSAYDTISETNYDYTADNSTEFMAAAYPVANLSSEAWYSSQYVNGNEYYAKIPKQALRKDCLAIQDAAANQWGVTGTVKGIGIVTQSYLDYHHCSQAAGYMYPGVIGGVIVLDGYYTGAAHEAGHTFGLYQTTEQYDLTAPADGLPANGVWVREQLDGGHMLHGQGRLQV